MSDPLKDWTNTTFAEAASIFNQGQPAKAEAMIRILLAANPNHDGAVHLMGLCALAQGRPCEATAWFKESLKSDPADPNRLSALGMAQKACGQTDFAIASLRRAALFDPANTQILINLANLLQDRGDFEDGLAQYRKAACLEPDNARLRYNLGLSLLTLGQYDEGFREAEWRWKAAGLNLEEVDFKAPLWQGEDMGGNTLLLWAEQGLGDTMMFCRYVPELARRGVRVLLQAPKSLHPILGSLKGLGGLFAEGDPLPAYDAHAPLLAVPGRMKTSVETIPAPVPYLKPPPERTEAWKTKLSSLPGLKVGLTWRGNPAHADDANRSISPDLLTPLFEVEGISWVAIQPEPGPAPPPIFNAGPELADWGDTAGLVENLDLVVSVDSSTAHLAGAMAKDCWLMLPFLPDWRWGLNSHQTPWYPNTTLFRQESPGDWPGVIRRLQQALRTYRRP